MGLDARDYMRRDGRRWAGPASWSVTTRLIVVNVLLWFLYATSTSWGGPGTGLSWFFTEYLALHPRDVFGKLRLWQPFTAMWLHDPAGLGHIFFNMLFLYFFGRVVEGMVGRRSYLTLYLGGGIASMLAMLPLSAVTRIDVALGASGAVYAVGVFAALRAPRMRVILFIVPMTLAVMVFGVMLGYELLSVALRMGSLGTSVAHLVGGAFGFVYDRHLRRGGVPWLRPAARPSSPIRPAPPPPAAAEDRARMDRLLEKIHAEGIGSLTEEEKRFLEQASRRLRR